MADSHNVLKQASSFEVSPEQEGYSKVVIYTGQQYQEGDPEVIAGLVKAGEDVIYEAGTDTGKVLETRNEFATPEMAQNILNQVQGWQYQPYEAKGAFLDPAAELGDGVTINDTYSGIYVRATTFSRHMRADISAPVDTEIEHEMSASDPSDRAYSRFVRATRAEMVVNAAEIRARVEKESMTGSGAESFGWELLSDHWSVFSGESEILRATKNGLTVHGRIEADEGYIGGAAGFILKASKMYSGGIDDFNQGNYGDEGIYIGTDGIRLGDYFKVGTDGVLRCKNVELTGTLTIGSDTITANDLRKGANFGNGYGGSSWNTNVSSAGTICSGGNAFGNMIAHEGSTAYAKPIHASSFRLDGTQYTKQSKSFVDYYGNTVTIYYLGIARE